MKKNLLYIQPVLLSLTLSSLPLNGMEAPVQPTDIAQQETSSHSEQDGLPTHHIVLSEAPETLSLEDNTPLFDDIQQEDFTDIIIEAQESETLYNGHPLIKMEFTESPELYDDYPLAHVALNENTDYPAYDTRETAPEKQTLKSGLTWGHMFSYESATDFVKRTLKDGTFQKNNVSYLDQLELAMKNCIKNNDLPSIIEIEDLCFSSYNEDYLPLSKQIRECCYPLAMAHYYKTQSNAITSLDQFEQKRKESAQTVARQIAELIAVHQKEMNELLIKLNDAQQKSLNDLPDNHNKAEWVTAFLNRGSKEEQYVLPSKEHVIAQQNLVKTRHNAIDIDIKNYHLSLANMHNDVDKLALNNK